MKKIRSFFEDLVSIFYPNSCGICGKNLIKDENTVCILCLYKIPKTNCFKKKENSVSQIFWGRVQIETAAALNQFHKEGSIQKLIYQLKYEDRKSTGIFLEKQIGYAINESPFFCNLDYIIHVPLHPKKNLEDITKVNILLRGYKKY